MLDPQTSKRQLLFALQAAEWIITYREREMCLNQAKAYSFAHEYELLQLMPQDKRPANHAEVLAHVETNILYFRERLERCKERYTRTRQDLHRLLATIVHYFPTDDIYTLCVRIVQLPMPEVALPGSEVQTQQELERWLSSIQKQVKQVKPELVVEIERLKKLLKD